MANKITLTKKQAIRALSFISELESLIGEQLWDNHHPFGAQEKRELNRLKNSLYKKVQRLTKRPPDETPESSELAELGKQIFKKAKALREASRR